MATCKRCGEYFHRDPAERWERLCLECWIELRNDRARIESLEAENTHLRRQNEQLIARLFMPSRHLKFLIFATHPDRNGGSRQAGEVTRFLLDYKQKTRDGNAGFSKN